MKRKLIALGAGVFMALALTGCAQGYTPSSDDGEEDPNRSYTDNGLDVQKVTLPDGSTVVCITFSTNGGISCDWEHVVGASTDAN